MDNRNGRTIVRLSGIIATVFYVLAAVGQDSATLHYKLQAGDHLIYRETFERDGQSPENSFRARTVFLNHVVVLDVAGGMALVGVQRNRQSSELLEYHEHGKDKLAQETVKFKERAAKRPVFADANVLSAAGEPQMPLAIVREAYSRLLYGISEIAPLPSNAAAAGSEIQGPLGVKMKLVSSLPASGDACVQFADTGKRKNLHLSYKFCPAPGTLAKLEFSGEYHEFGESLIRERVTLELLESHHGEQASAWLGDASVQQAALRAYLVAAGAVPDPQALATLLRTGTPEVQALTLAVYYQKKLTPPSDSLAPLATSDNPEVRRIAARFAATPPTAAGPCTLPPPHYLREKPATILRSMTASGFAGTPYMVHIPIDYRGDQPFPLIVYLSGGGGQAFDGALSAEDTLGHSGYIALYPHAGGELWWQARQTAMVYALLLETLRSYNIDTNRVYLVGFSNGATAALYYATLWPDRFAAVASLMGAGMHIPNGETLPLENLQNVPVLFLHGDKDRTIPASSSVATADQLRSLHPRAAPEIHILKERGHDITLDSDDGLAVPFLERFRREPFPRNIAMKVVNLEYPRRYWVEVLEKDKGAAEIDARILSDNTIELKTKNAHKLRLLLRPELMDGGVHIRVNGREQPPRELTQDCTLFVNSVNAYADPFLGYMEAVIEP